MLFSLLSFFEIKRKKKSEWNECQKYLKLYSVFLKPCSHVQALLKNVIKKQRSACQLVIQLRKKVLCCLPFTCLEGNC